jgi:hypothetical protein
LYVLQVLFAAMFAALGIIFFRMDAASLRRYAMVAYGHAYPLPTDR